MVKFSSSSSSSVKPVKVLCFYRAWSRRSGKTLTFTDSVMIQVRRDGDILEAFQAEMKRRSSPQYDRFRVGPTPTVYELVSYITENGKERFNSFRG